MNTSSWVRRCSLVLVLLGCGAKDGDSGSGIFSSSAATIDSGSELSDEVDDSTVESGDASDQADTSGSTTASEGTSAGTTDTTDGSDEGGESCGNGVIDPGEQCDGANLNGISCASLGFVGGELACDPTICVFDTSGCTNDNGNQCDAFCNGCTCPSPECTMCCAQLGKVDTCGGGMCGCF